MALSRSASILTLLLLVIGQSVLADVGTRQLLLHERQVLIERAEPLRGDTSAATMRRADSLHAAIIALDGRIFASYNETFSRLSAQQRRRAVNDRALTLFALVCCIIALMCLLALWLAARRMDNGRGIGLMPLLRSLMGDMAMRVNPDSAESAAATRVSPVVIIGVLGMVISIAVYLVGRLL